MKKLKYILTDILLFIAYNNTLYMITLNTGEDYELNTHTGQFIRQSSYKKINKIKGKYTLEYNGNLYKDDVKIAENINDMSNVYNDNFFCDNYDNVLMAYKDSIFYEIKSSNIEKHLIEDTYICMITTDHIIYKIKCERWMLDINTCNMYNFPKMSLVQNNTNKIGCNHVAKIVKSTIVMRSSYIYLDNNAITFGDNFYNIMPTSYNVDDVIDIYCVSSLSKSLIVIKKDSSIDILRMEDYTPMYDDSFILDIRIHLDGQFVKYNGKNIFKINNVFDVIENIKYLTKNTKIQINVLLCVLKRHIIMPKTLKLLIISKLIT